MIDLKLLKKNQEVFVKVTGKKGKVKSVRQVSDGTLVTVKYPNGGMFMTEDPNNIDLVTTKSTMADVSTLRLIPPR